MPQVCTSLALQPMLFFEKIARKPDKTTRVSLFAERPKSLETKAKPHNKVRIVSTKTKSTENQKSKGWSVRGCLFQLQFGSCFVLKKVQL